MSNIITLDLYNPVNKTKIVRKKQSKISTTFHELFGPQKWIKYFEVETPLVNDFELYNIITKKVGKGVTFRYLKDSTRIIEASNAKQSELLQELMTKDDPNLKVNKNIKLNASHGTVLIPNSVLIKNKEFTECSQLIKENIELQDFVIQDIKTYVRPPLGNRKYSLRIAQITFSGRVLPDTVVIGGQRLC